MQDNGLDIYCEHSFKTVVGILSNPDDILLFRLAITFITSGSLVGYSIIVWVHAFCVKFILGFVVLCLFKSCGNDIKKSFIYAAN